MGFGAGDLSPGGWGGGLVGVVLVVWRVALLKETLYDDVKHRTYKQRLYERRRGYRSGPLPKKCADVIKKA